MKERPIIMNAESVRAIQTGTKTQTRRVMRIQPPGENWQLATLLFTTGSNKNVDKHQWVKMDGDSIIDEDERLFRCSYGYVGDQLWLREPWRLVGCGEGVPSTIEYRDGTRLEEPHSSDYYDWGEGGYPTRWRSPRFMPYWASRITLEITDIRVARLQDISEEDAIAEGADISMSVTGLIFGTHRGEYSRLWDLSNEKRGHGWDTNPWVWIINFQPIS